MQRNWLGICIYLLAEFRRKRPFAARGESLRPQTEKKFLKKCTREKKNNNNSSGMLLVSGKGRNVSAGIQPQSRGGRGCASAGVSFVSFRLGKAGRSRRARPWRSRAPCRFQALFNWNLFLKNNEH